MRGLRPLFGVAVALCGVGASAQEMIEVPTTTAPPPPPCCTVIAPPPPRAPESLLLQLVVGPTYRRAFKEDFAAALLELELGAQNPRFGVGARLSAALGATRVGLPYQFITIGPAFNFRLTPRVRFAVAATFGALVYQRASAAAIDDPNVWGLSAGVNGTVGVDLVRTARDGAVYLLGRIGYDYVDNTGRDALDTGSSLSLTAALGYRY